MKIVVKVGTSTLTHSSGKINIRRIEELCKVLSDLKNAGNEVVLVSSGAIGMGVSKLKLGARPEDIPTKQAAAAVGQCALMYEYDKFFSEYGYVAAQVLVTADDFNSFERNENFKNTLERLLQLETLPVINENDTVSTAEIAVGDNDTLAARVAVSINADLLVLLSDIDGLYTADPHKNGDAKLISTVHDIDGNILSLAGGAGSGLGTGGMETKLKAARICCDSGIDMIIANGNKPENLYAAVDGKNIGTRFIGKK